jgi:hypothetical protein
MLHPTASGIGDEKWFNTATRIPDKSHDEPNRA